MYSNKLRMDCIIIKVETSGKIASHIVYLLKAISDGSVNRLVDTTLLKIADSTVNVEVAVGYLRSEKDTRKL